MCNYYYMCKNLKDKSKAKSKFSKKFYVENQYITTMRFTIRSIKEVKPSETFLLEIYVFTFYDLQKKKLKWFSFPFA